VLLFYYGKNRLYAAAVFFEDEDEDVGFLSRKERERERRTTTITTKTRSPSSISRFCKGLNYTRIKHVHRSKGSQLKRLGFLAVSLHFVSNFLTFARAYILLYLRLLLLFKS